MSAELYSNANGFEFMHDGFDINAAFQEALHGIVSDRELELGEKIRRMESVVLEGNSDTYRNFIDFRSIALQIEAACAHDHALNNAVQSSESLTTTRDDHISGNEYGHHDIENDKNKKNSKAKKKKKRGWLQYFLDEA